ncbi:hypothetical protein D3C73_1113350 [compost metagenome]
MSGSHFITVLFRGFIGGFTARDAQAFRLHLSGETVHIVARSVSGTVEFTAAHKDPAFEAEVANQRIQHHHRPGVVKSVACHHPAVGDHRRFTPVTGKGVRQRAYFCLRHAALLAVLR